MALEPHVPVENVAHAVCRGCMLDCRSGVVVGEDRIEGSNATIVAEGYEGASVGSRMVSFVVLFGLERSPYAA